MTNATARRKIDLTWRWDAPIQMRPEFENRVAKAVVVYSSSGVPILSIGSSENDRYAEVRYTPSGVSYAIGDLNDEGDFIVTEFGYLPWSSVARVQTLLEDERRPVA